MSTVKSKYNNKHGYPKNESHSVEDISKTPSIKNSILQEVYDRGIGAWKSNPTSVRSKSGAKKDSGYPLSKRMTKERWAYGRVYGFVMKNPKQVGDGKPDSDLYEKI